MAKQTGIIALRGKIKGQSYYGSKVGGDLVRTINEGMSARVKTGKEYANTRKNNSEFGMCGDFAGAIIKPITLRWRFILDSIATGKMVKTMKDLLKQDSTGKWGQRIVPTTEYPSLISSFNSFSKNEMQADIENIASQGISWDSNSNAVRFASKPSMSVNEQNELINEGVNHVQVKVFALQVTHPTFDQNAMSYVKAVGNLIASSGIDVDSDLTAEESLELFTTATFTHDFADVVSGTQFGGVLVLYLPCRKVGNAVSILQEKCSAKLYPVSSL